jgi:hypothetical protein
MQVNRLALLLVPEPEDKALCQETGTMGATMAAAGASRAAPAATTRPARGVMTAVSFWGKLFFYKFRIFKIKKIYILVSLQNVHFFNFII